MIKTRRLVAAAAALAFGGSMALVAAPASAMNNADKSNCQGKAVRACVQLRDKIDWDRPALHDFAWAKISDNQKDHVNYTVWVNHLQLQVHTSKGWKVAEHSADTDGTYSQWETASTARFKCGGIYHKKSIRARASFHWEVAGSNTVYSRTIFTGSQETVCST